MLGFIPAMLQAGNPEEYPGESAKWRRYQSPHFELFSANNDHESRELLHNLEILRALFLDTFKLKERQPLEVTIYYFKKNSDFSHYVSGNLSGNKNIAGYYMSQPDRGTIVVSPMWDDVEARHVIFHEYIHHLIGISGEAPPLWYNEGVAELYSSIEIGDNTLDLGKPLPWHLITLQHEALLPLEELFEVDFNSSIYKTGKHSGRFYAESWGLLHYWFYGDSNLDRAKVSRFMDYIRNETTGADPVRRRELFEETMGMDYAAMGKLLDHYVKSGSFRWGKISLPKIANSKGYEWRTLEAGETRERLAELDLRANQSGRARLAFLRAAELTPLKAKLQEVLGSDSWMQGEPDRARERWQKAVELGSNNPAVFHELGLMESRRWFARFDFYFRMPDDLAQRLRALLMGSIKCAPDQTDAYEMLAWIEGTVEKPNIANVNLVQKHFDSLGQKGPTLVALAMVRVHRNEWPAALVILDRAETKYPEAAMAAMIRQIRSHQPVASEVTSGTEANGARTAEGAHELEVK